MFGLLNFFLKQVFVCQWYSWKKLTLNQALAYLYPHVSLQTNRSPVSLLAQRSLLVIADRHTSPVFSTVVSLYLMWTARHHKPILSNHRQHSVETYPRSWHPAKPSSCNSRQNFKKSLSIHVS